jgi:hypothetical protein
MSVESVLVSPGLSRVRKATTDLPAICERGVGVMRGDHTGIGSNCETQGHQSGDGMASNWGGQLLFGSQ